MRTLTPELLLANTKRMGKCRVWKGTLRGDGLPQVGYRGKKLYVTRLMYELLHPDEDLTKVGVVHVHTCKYKACIEPTHLVAVPKSEVPLYRKAHAWMVSDET